MNDWLTAENASWAPTAWWLADLALRATLIFAAAIGATACLRNASAATRHFVWLAAFVGAGLLPMMSTTLPNWHVSLGDHASAAEAPLELAALDQGAEENTVTADATASTAPWKETLLASQSSETAAAPIVAPAVAPVKPAQPWPWATIVVSAWLIGVVGMLLPLLGGAISLARLGRRARNVEDARLLAIFDDAKSRLGCRRDVRLLESDARQVPMTWGVFRPAVLLPVSARSWSAAQLRMVLLHELAHVSRADCATQWLVQICRAMYWYQPLAWIAYKQLRREQEQACDDRVLADGCQAPDYAEHLVAVAAGLAPQRWAAAVALAMADRSRMERRVTAILNDQVNRRALSQRGALAGIAVAAIVIVPVASYTATPRRAEAGFRSQAMAREIERMVVHQAAAPAAEQNGVAPGALAELQEHVTKRYVTAPDEASLVRGAMRGMVDALNDPHSEVMTAAELAQLERQIKGALSGIGAQLEMRDGRPTVATPLENSPALKAGVRPGDVIVEIDGTAAGDDLQQVASRIMGPADSKVKLLVQRGDGSRATVEIVRAAFKLPTVQGYIRGGNDKWDYVLDAQHKIGYLRITQFGAETAAEVRDAMAAAREPLKGLILDLRYCPGGLMAQSIDVVRLFAPTGEIVTLRGRDGSEQKIGEGDAPAAPALPLVVLVNEYTASSAEIVSGALQANHCAVVVGSRTHGKASVQELVRLEDGTGIRLTTAFYHLPGGRNIHKRPGEATWGVDPDEGYFVPMSRAQNERFLQDLKGRERLSLATATPAEGASLPSVDNAAFQQLDPQLAAGWQAMIHRLEKGQFQATGRTLAEMRSYVTERELASRRGELVSKLEEVSRELRELDASIGQ